MTREEFESILEEAFLEGYNDAIDEIFEEDSSFDLESEMDSYNENLADYQKEEIKKDFDKYKKNNPDARKKELSNYLKFKVAGKAAFTNDRMADGYGYEKDKAEDDYNPNATKLLNKLKEGKLKAGDRMRKSAKRYGEKIDRSYYINKIKNKVLKSN